MATERVADSKSAPTVGSDSRKRGGVRGDSKEALSAVDKFFAEPHGMSDLLVMHLDNTLTWGVLQQVSGYKDPLWVEHNVAVQSVLVRHATVNCGLDIGFSLDDLSSVEKWTYKVDKLLRHTDGAVEKRVRLICKYLAPYCTVHVHKYGVRVTPEK